MADKEKALECAVRALARRDHSIAEIERKLRNKNLPAAVIAETLDRLAQSGYLDDRRFAGRWAEAAVRGGRGYGVRLRMELLRRGVDREIIEEVLTGIAATHGEEETLAAVAGKKFAAFRPHEATEQDKRRVMAYLQRRGFSTAAIFRFFREATCCSEYNE